MDTIIPEDLPLFNFLSDKNQGLLLQTSNETSQIEENTTIIAEPMYTELVDGNTASWIYLNGPILTATEESQQIEANIIETDANNRLQTLDPTETIGFPIEIPGKGFLTSSGLFFSNEVLLELNLCNNVGSVDKPTESPLQYFCIKSSNTEKATREVQNQPGTEEILIEQIAEEPDMQNMIEIVSVHKCKGCSALFERYEQIAAHIKNCDKTNPKMSDVSPIVQKMSSLINKDENKKPVVKDIYLCGICDNVGCENIDNLRRHMLAKHNLTYNPDYEKSESEAARRTKNKQFFQGIINKILAEGRKIKCSIKGCEARFPRLELMMKHHECHVNEERKKFKCLECDKIFFVWRLCSAHMWKTHKLDIGLYTCTFCKAFKTLSPHNLLIHMCTHDSETYKPFLCTICGKDFEQVSHLKNHERFVHKEFKEVSKRASKISCTICSRMFSNSKVLKKHIQAVHNKYKPFICNICGHQCARKAMLELHLRQHTGEKPYKCEVCDYKTGDHNSLRRHTNRHYGTTNYSCPHCDYQTIQSIAFKLHLKRKHPGKDGYYSCLVCSYDTVNEQLYNEHLKEHTMGLLKGGPIKLETINKSGQTAFQAKVPNIEDDETQPGLFSSDHIEDMAVDTGGITIPAGSEIHV